jgi:hypothetical protein
VGENRRADGADHAGHLFCCNQASGLKIGEK